MAGEWIDGAAPDRWTLSARATLKMHSHVHFHCATILADELEVEQAEEAFWMMLDCCLSPTIRL